MPGNYSRVHIYNDGDTLTAANYNGELDTIRTNWTPAGLDDASATVSAMQTTVDPGESGSESLATSLEGEIQRLRHMVKEITGKTYWYESPSASLLSVAPIGTIIPFYDFNAAVSFNNAVWAYCDGSTISDASSPLNGKTLPDLSNRYLVGFGTEGGGDIDTATWNATVVGNANHQINVQHTHTDAGHVHSFSHSHGAGTLQFQVANWTASNMFMYDSGGSAVGVIGNAMVNGGSTVGGTILSATGTGYTKNGSGSTATESSNVNTGNAQIQNALSSTQSIQPRSVRVRFLMRYK